MQPKVNLSKTDSLKVGLLEKDLAACRVPWKPATSSVLKAINPSQPQSLACSPLTMPGGGLHFFIHEHWIDSLALEPKFCHIILLLYPFPKHMAQSPPAQGQDLPCEIWLCTTLNLCVLPNRHYSNESIRRWSHFNDRKWKGTKDPLDEGERGEWESWLKIQPSKKWISWHLVPSLHSK